MLRVRSRSSGDNFMMLRESIGGNSAHLEPPADRNVGWQYVADVGAYIAIGPRLFSTTKHLHNGWLPGAIAYRGESYAVVDSIDPGHDCLFLIVDRDVPDWCEPFISDEFLNAQQGSVHERELYMVGRGHGYGTIEHTEEGVKYFWGTTGTEAMRWCRNGAFQWYGGTVIVRFDEGSAASQDSGYGVFIVHDGKLKYLGQLVGAKNPSILDGFWTIANMGPWLFKELLAPYFGPVTPPIPPQPPPAPAIAQPRMEFAFDVTASETHQTVIEASDDNATWTQVATGQGNFTFRETAKDARLRTYRAKTLW